MPRARATVYAVAARAVAPGDGRGEYPARAPPRSRRTGPCAQERPVSSSASCNDQRGDLTRRFNKGPRRVPGLRAMLGTVTVRLVYRQSVYRVSTTAGQHSRGRGLPQKRTYAFSRDFAVWLDCDGCNGEQGGG